MLLLGLVVYPTVARARETMNTLRALLIVMLLLWGCSKDECNCPETEKGNSTQQPQGPTSSEPPPASPPASEPLVDNEDLILWAREGNLTQVQRLLNKGTNPVPEDNNGLTALWCAAAGEYTEIVRALITAGAEVDVKGSGGSTALMLASQNGHTEIVRVLINAGDDVNARDSYGSTALMQASGPERTEIRQLLRAAGATE